MTNMQTRKHASSTPCNLSPVTLNRYCPAMKWTVNKVLIVVLVGGFLLRLGAALGWEHHFGERFTFGDSDGYWTLARAVAHGEPYQYGSADLRVFRAPGYPIFLAPVFLMGGDQVPILWARLLSALFGTATMAGVWWFGRRLFNDRVGLFAAAITAIYPGAIALSIVVLSEAPFCPLMIAQLALWTCAVQAKSRTSIGMWAISAGLVAGAATLVRPSWLLFTPLVVAVSVVWGKQRVREVWVGCLLLLGMTLAMLPWWVRNYCVTGRFIPTTLQVGASLYDGLSPMATGASDMRFVTDFEEAERRKPSDQASGDCFEYRLDRRLKNASLDWACQNPSRVVLLAVTKCLRIWNIWPNEPSFSAWPARIVVVFTFVPILVLGIIGTLRTFRFGWPYRMCWLPAVYLTLIHMVFVSSVRYREPAMLGIIVLAASVLAGWRGTSTKEGCCPLSAV